MLRGGASGSSNENEWLMPRIEETIPAPATDSCEFNRHDLLTSVSGVGDQTVDRDHASLLTILPECELTDQAKDHMDTLDIREMYADISTEEDIDKMVD